MEWLEHWSIGVLVLDASLPYSITPILQSLLLRCSYPNLIQVPQQVSRILIDAIGARLFELILAVTAGEQADSKRTGPAGSQEIPDAIAHHDGVTDLYA